MEDVKLLNLLEDVRKLRLADRKSKELAAHNAQHGSMGKQWTKTAQERDRLYDRARLTAKDYFNLKD